MSAATLAPDAPAPADPAAERVRVIIADGDPISRRVIRDGFQAEDGFVVAADARDGVEAVELGLFYRPEIMILEATLPRLHGLEATARIHEAVPETRIVMFSVVDDDHDLELAAFRAGASGFITKRVGLDGLIRAIRAVLRGEACASRSLTTWMIERLCAMPDSGVGMRPVISLLTPREWEVLDMITLGGTTASIAAELVVAPDTIYSHVKGIMRKLGVHSRAEMVEAGRSLRTPATAQGRLRAAIG